MGKKSKELTLRVHPLRSSNECCQFGSLEPKCQTFMFLQDKVCWPKPPKPGAYIYILAVTEVLDATVYACLFQARAEPSVSTALKADVALDKLLQSPGQGRVCDAARLSLADATQTPKALTPMHSHKSGNSEKGRKWKRPHRCGAKCHV